MAGTSRAAAPTDGRRTRSDPNAVFSGNGETPLHVAARAWDVPMMEALVSHGGDIARRRADGRTPYALAELNGNHAVAEWLLAHGASPELSDLDRLEEPLGHRVVAVQLGER